MRDITFCGKTLDGGKWIYGDLRQYNPGCAGIHARNIGHTIKVDPNTVGQYTGMTDKNGKQIFEGDVIKAKIEGGNHSGFEWKHMRVGFTQGTFCLIDGTGGMFCALGAFASSVTLEVVGNIHDTPELRFKEE